MSDKPEKMEKKPAPAEPKRHSPASQYTPDQLAEGCKALGASRELVTAALKRSGRSAFTLREAQELVDKFKTQEVK